LGPTEAVQNLHAKNTKKSEELKDSMLFVVGCPTGPTEAVQNLHAKNTKKSEELKDSMLFVVRGPRGRPC
jgi:hypothetical protein